MAEALVSIILQQLALITRQQIEQEVKLVVGVDDEIQKLDSNIRAIRAVLADGEKKEVKNHAVRDWLDKLKDLFYDIDDVLDEWNTSVGKLHIKEVEKASKPVMREVCSLSSCYCFRKVVWRHDIAIKIKDLNKRLDLIVLEKNMLGLEESTVELNRSMTTSLIDVSMVQGRDDDKNKLLIKLLEENSQAPSISIVSIVGVGGIGKTTLARLAFNDERVKTHFEKTIWVCVSHPFVEIRVAKAILESIGGDNVSNLVEFETVLQKVKNSLQGKRFLLVLDDVWTDNAKDCEQLIESLKYGSRGSRIILTTRKMDVVNIMGASYIIQLGTLSEDKSWSLFSQVAFSEKNFEERKNLENIGWEIVGKCKGLPLAIKTLASLLRFKRNINEWKNVLDSEMWELEEAEEGLFPPLLLSYYDLPSLIKKCFLYCAIFPKDYKISRDDLILSWMSQSYLKEERNKDMELIGKEYFETLASYSFFQDFQENEFDGSITCCKMHDILHDFAQFLTKKECLNIEIDDREMPQVELSNKRGQHLRLQFRDEGSLLMCINNKRNLRSLVVEEKCTKMNSVTLSKLIGNLTCIRELDLRGHDIKELPREIENLIHLRYLNLSDNEVLEELPEALSELYNLQTLKLDCCSNLVKLPQGIGKLKNLRHLMIGYTRSLRNMPKGIEGLSCLRTLSDLKLSSSSHDGKACGIECLERLNNLRGSLKIRDLDHVTDVDKVKRANLQNKRNLLSLCLYFQNWLEDRRLNENDEIVLEALEPPSNLVELEIRSYEGKTKWPHWMVSLTQLRKLQIYGRSKCEYLPPLGKLESLEYLKISGMKSVKRVGNEFLGEESDGTATSTTPFPRLKTLEFLGMQEWEEWDITRRKDEDITIMPSLHSLKIISCNKLKVVPDSVIQTPTLKELEIAYSVLEASYEGKTIWPHWIVSLIQLKELRLYGCSKCEYLPPLGKLSSLEDLSISSVNSVKRVGNEFFGLESDGTSTSTMLFPKLKTLSFCYMGEWEEWDITRRRDEDITIMPCLHSLTIGSCNKLKALPDSVIQTPTLKELGILHCPVLEARYKKETGEDWAKISHIPYVSICR